MSIIYEALKKVEAANNITLIPKENFTLTRKPKVNKETQSKYKTYLFYGIVVSSGIFIASVFFHFFTRPLQINPNVASKIEPKIEKKPDVIGTSLATNIITPQETKMEYQPALTLNGIFFSQDIGYALINNQIIKVGDIIEGATVKRITMDEVELESAGSVIKLSNNR